VKQSIKKYIRQDYSIVQCTSCSFCFVNPGIDFSDAEWEEIYSDNYFYMKGTPWWINKQRENRTHRLNRMNRFLTSTRPVFLDIGCGEGEMLDEALKRNWIPHGIDIADNLRKDLKENKSITFTKGNFLKSRYPDESFDAIHMDSVLEHIPQPLDLLNTCHRILKKNGVVFISFPNEESLIRDFQHFIYTLLGKKDISVRLMPFRNPCHVSGFTRKTIERMAERSRLSIVSIDNIGGEDEWLKYPLTTKQFYMYFLLLPVYLAAHVLKRKIYFEIILQKS
jgi:2-polyprenyl-3-methyl-5-hydroxy-6-metoxy-1,4-benzoquinol methylase